MAFDAYLKFEGGPKIAGESTKKGFEKQIEIFSFSFGVSNPSTIGMTGGGGAGKASLSSFNVMKQTDTSSPVLFAACAKGSHFPKATVTLRKSGGDTQLNYLTYKFEEVYIDSVQWSGSSGGDDRPTESLSWSFGKVQMEYTAQTATGAAGDQIIESWDVRSQTK